MENHVQEPIFDRKKNTIFTKMKKIMRYRSIMSITIVLLIIISMYGLHLVTQRYATYGVRFHVPITLEKYHTYSDQDKDVTFRYTDRYVIDMDDQHKYGASYIAGMHRADDVRTGCDIRFNAVGINFAKTDQEINDAIYRDLSQSVKGLADFTGERMVIDGENAMRVDFDLVDPLGSTLRISQVIVTHNDVNYLIACGSNASQYEFFESDFQLLFESLKWAK